jgi:hypothetical protein
VSAPDTFVGPQSTALVVPSNPALVEGAPVAGWVREMLWTAAHDLPRARQTSIGPSQLGLACSRQIAYQIAGTVPVNFDVDPLPSMVGTAMHAFLASVFAGLRPRGRYLVEHPVTYAGVSGTLDLYDRRTGTVIDWKFPKLAKVRRTLSDGPPRHYQWQLQTYAAGLIAAGETPVRLAVVYIPIDGALSDVTAWTYPVTPTSADEAVDRLSTVRTQLGNTAHPGAVPAQPSRLCPWCPFHRPKWTGDLDIACPGEETTT